MMATPQALLFVRRSAGFLIGAGRRSRACASVAHQTSGAKDARATAFVDVDQGRLARRLRLSGDAQQEALRVAPDGIGAVHNSLIAGGHLDANSAQASAAVAFSQLAGALSEARAAHVLWIAERERLEALAKKAKEKLERKREELENATKFQKLKNRLDDSEIVKIEKDAEQSEARARNHRLAPVVLRPAGCYVHGPTGTGKTMLMDVYCMFGCIGLRVRRQHFHEFSLWLHESLHALSGKNPDAPKAHVLGRIADTIKENVDVLCIDEFAVTNTADAVLFTELFKLVAERYVAVCVTTNRPPEDLYNEGLNRERFIPALVERIRSNMLVCGVEGSDYREEMFQTETNGISTVADGDASSPKEPSAARSALPLVFFEGGEADVALSTALAHDDGGMPAMTPSQLSVSWGRKMKVPSAGAGVACFSFDDLCRQSLSAEDFLFITQEYHTIFVHDVPRLSIEEHNEARRFTNLVDALYEHTVRLICHSKVPMDEILLDVEALCSATEDSHDADRMGLFNPPEDDTPNFQLQIKEGGRDKYEELMKKRKAREVAAHSRQLAKQKAPETLSQEATAGAEGTFSTAPAVADMSAPQDGAAGVMVAAVGCLQESGFAARRALSRLKEMQTAPYLHSAHQRREAMMHRESVPQ